MNLRLIKSKYRPHWIRPMHDPWIRGVVPIGRWLDGVHGCMGRWYGALSGNVCQFCQDLPGVSWVLNRILRGAY